MQPQPLDALRGKSPFELFALIHPCCPFLSHHNYPSHPFCSLVTYSLTSKLFLQPLLQQTSLPTLCSIDGSFLLSAHHHPAVKTGTEGRETLLHQQGVGRPQGALMAAARVKEHLGLLRNEGPVSLRQAKFIPASGLCT